MPRNDSVVTFALSSLVASTLLLGGCTEPKETTAMGAAAGGALGAGLGAIIGSQTGSAGGGLVIGALAGSASGALIGNAFQAQQESMRSQDEAIERQERMIDAQRNEIGELRKMNSDEVGRKQVYLRERGPNPGASRASTSSVAMAEPRARLGATAGRNVGTEHSPTPSAYSEARSAGAPTTSAAGTDAEASDNTPRAANIDPNRGSCKEAEREGAAATAAKDDSDKLFHLRRALRLCPENPKYHYDLGKVYLSLNRQSDAEYEFKQALSSDPSYRPARTSLDALEKKGGERF